MRKIITFLIIFTITIPTVFADGISVYLNGKQLSFEQEPIIQDDFTLVPFRTIFSELDMTVQWFEDEQRVTAEKENTAITLFINKPVIYVNDKEIALDTTPIIYNNFTLVPLRAVSEAAGAEVSWDGITRTVTITAQQSEFDDWAKQVLALTNVEREKRGRKPLKWDDSLAKLATAHCEDMINRSFFAHDNPDGATPFDRMKNAGISYREAGENIAAGQYSPEAVVKSWMNSQGHMKNILNPSFESLGVGVVKGGKYGIYWAQEFATLK
ncbi:MAG: hypothetical protein HFE52_08310 [Clostridia bacterium]|nr:hypothetical protein [Clostridia bacterium]MCI8980650.1 hypothetical protein [Clostridia bacterium]